MSLKYKVDTIEGLDESVAALYEKQGDVYVLSVEGAVDKSRIDEFRDNNIKLMKQLEQFKDVDLEQYQELIKKAKEDADKKLIDAGKIDELLEERTKAMKQAAEQRERELIEQINSTNSQLSSLLIDNAVRDAASKHKVLSSAIDDVLLRAKSKFTLEDGKAVIKDGDRIVYGANGDPMTPAEWVKSLSSEAPHLFEGSRGSGAAGNTGANSASTANLSPVQKIQAGLIK